MVPLGGWDRKQADSVYWARVRALEDAVSRQLCHL